MKSICYREQLQESKKSKSGKHIHIFLEMDSIHKTFRKFKVNLFSFCILFITGIWQLSDSQSSSWTEYTGSSSLNKSLIFVVEWAQQRQEKLEWQKAFLFLKFQLKSTNTVTKEIDPIFLKVDCLSRCRHKCKRLWSFTPQRVLSPHLSEIL